MASLLILKRNINYVLGDIIEAVYIWELTNPKKDDKILVCFIICFTKY